jgi:electron transport complex protein RnfC
VARTKLKKARDALKNAEDKGLEGIDKLRATLTTLEQKADEAEQAFKAAEQSQLDAAAAQGVGLKQLKIDAALARAAVTKLERALAKTEDEQARTEIETELTAARDKADQLNQTLQQHEPA